MPTYFAITAGSERLNLADETVVVFTVVNKLGRDVRARVSIRTEGEAKPSWFRLTGEAEREMIVDGVYRYEVEARPPADTDAGRYAFWLLAQSVDDPDEIWDEGQHVLLEIGRSPSRPEPTRKFPWWIVAAGAVVLVVLTAVVVFLLARRGSESIGAQTCTEGQVVVGVGDDGRMLCETATPPGDDVPPGSVVAFAGSTAPPGWRLCDGSAIGRAEHAELFAAIGIAHGMGDGVSTFNLPDLQGRFLRGVDDPSDPDGAPRDPDRDARASSNPGGNSGNAVGSTQADAFQRHAHEDNFPAEAAFWSQASHPTVQVGRNYAIQNVTFAIGQPTALAPDAPDDLRFGAETRPQNVYVNWIIKL